MSYSRNEDSVQSRRRVVGLRGFTIIELLVVVVVVAILAAVVVVSYRSASGMAREASLKSDLTSATAELSRYNLKNRTYPTDGSALRSSSGSVLSYQSDGRTFCLSVYHESNRGAVFHITQEQKILSGRCTPMTTDVAIGSSHTCSIASGVAYCWGGVGFGQLGNVKKGTNTHAVVDTSGVLAGKTLSAISAGEYSSCAVASSKVYCWGRNNYGQLGDGSLTNSVAPVAVDTSGVLAGKTVTAVSAGQAHVCVVASGQVYCWGYNYSGQLGNGSTTNSSTPVAVDASGALAGKTVTAIAAGGIHTCAIASGQTYCWGGTSWGRLGDGLMVDSAVPVAVSTSGSLAGKTVTAIATGGSHTCAIASGQAYCWGYNADGQVGTGVTNSSYRVPVPVSTAGPLAGKTVTGIAVGASHTCAVASGQAYCWGRNVSGQLGNNSTANALVPVAVDTAGVLSGKVIATISAGYGHTCTTSAGQVFCWGTGSSGQLGGGVAAGSLVPVQMVAYPE